MITTKKTTKSKKAKQKLFLELLSKNERIKDAADAVGIASQTHYDWIRKDKVYKDAYEALTIEISTKYKDRCIELAKDGLITALEAKERWAVKKVHDNLMQKDGWGEKLDVNNSLSGNITLNIERGIIGKCEDE